MGKFVLHFFAPIIFGFEQTPEPIYTKTAVACASIYNFQARRGFPPENMECTDTRTGEVVWSYRHWFDSDQQSPPVAP